jgi:single stranded DNA-binding protein
LSCGCSRAGRKTSTTPQPGDRERHRLLRRVDRRRGRGGEDRGAFFIDLVAFNGLAKVCEQYLAKGSRILVDAQLDVQEWTGQDGNKRWTPKLIADQVEFLDPAPARDSSTEAEPQPAEATA